MLGAVSGMQGALIRDLEVWGIHALLCQHTDWCFEDGWRRRVSERVSERRV